MKETIKKFIYNKLSLLSDKEVLLWLDVQVAFNLSTKKSLSNYSDDTEEIINELENRQYAIFKELPNNMIRVTKGVDFDKWVI